MDELLLSFVKDNLVTIGLVLSILKAIAVETETAVDDKIWQLLSGFFSNARSKK